MALINDLELSILKLTLEERRGLKLFLAALTEGVPNIALSQSPLFRREMRYLFSQQPSLHRNIEIIVVGEDEIE